jgi:phage recombination protein Bet
MSNVTALERIEKPTGALALTSDQIQWTPAQRAALVQIGLDKADDANLSVFLHYCQRTGMDPFTRQIYMIGRWDRNAGRLKYTIQMAIDGFRIIAQRSLQYAGQTEPQWCGPDGVWKDVWVDHTKPPVAARIGVLRHGWPQPTYAVAHFAEFAPMRDGKLEPMWQRMPANQIAKCAEAAALRKAFPNDLSGMYVPEELEKDAEFPTMDPPTTPEQEKVDWDTKLDEARGDYDKLRALWSLARGLEPNNLALLERIAEAGEAAKQGTAQQPDVVDAEVIEDLKDPAKRPASKGQLQKLAIVLGERGLKDRSQKLAVLSARVNRTLTSTTELSSSEADTLVKLFGDDSADALVADILAHLSDSAEAGVA